MKRNWQGYKQGSHIHSPHDINEFDERNCERKGKKLDDRRPMKVNDIERTGISLHDLGIMKVGHDRWDK